MTNINKITPTWFVQNDVLRLSIHYWKKSETSDSHSGCSANWSRQIDGDFVSAYNWIVDAAKQTFNLPEIKKIKVPKNQNTIKKEEHDPTIIAMTFFIGMIFGAILLKILG